MENIYYIVLRDRTLPDDPFGNTHFIYHQVEGKPVVIESYEALDLFVHRSYDFTDSYVVSCGKTGQSVGYLGLTEEVAIKYAREVLNEKEPSNVLELLNSAFLKYHSPRWKNMEERANV